MAPWNGRWIIVLRAAAVLISTLCVVLVLRIIVELQLLEDLLEFMCCSWRATYSLRGGVVINHNSGCARAARMSP